MKSYEAVATIKATPEVIWAILTDAARYTTWDSGVLSVEGTIALRQRIKVASQVDPKRASAVTVHHFDPNERMVWRSGIPLGLFKAERTFTLIPGGDSVDFKMREEFSGLFAKMITSKMPDLGPSFEQFVNGLKAEAESGA